MNLLNKKSISPLIATILLIVVSVILITVVLTWGSSFAKENLNSVTTLDQLTKSDLSSFIVLDSFSQTETGNNIIIRNLHSSKDLNLIGYKLVTDSNYVFSNQLLYFDEVIGITPGEVRSLDIICFPEREFILQLVNKDLTYVTLPIKASNYRSQAYCMGREGVVAAYDMKTIVDNTLIDLSRNGNNGIIFDAISTKSGLYFDGFGDYISIGNSYLINENIPFTICAHVYLDNFSTNTYPAIITLLVDNELNNWRLIVTSSSSYSYISFGNNNWVKLRASNISSPVGNWHNIIVSYNGLDKNNAHNFILYFDGEEQILVASGSYAAHNSGINTIGTGRPARIDHDWVGNIKDIRIFNRILSQKEISDYHSVMSNPLD